ncbi:MAG: hypothetical protein WBA74_27985 [Cyclobacteriaceae bacterium]
MKKYLLLYVVFTATLFIVGLAMQSLPEVIHQDFLWLMIFFFLQSLFIAYMHYLAQTDRERLPLYFFGGLVFRMLTIILMLGVIYIAKVPDRVLFTINSGVIYLLYLTFEIILLLVNLRPNSEENG